MRAVPGSVVSGTLELCPEERSLTLDRTEGVEPETALMADEADANPVAAGTAVAAGSNGEAPPAEEVGRRETLARRTERFA